MKIIIHSLILTVVTFGLIGCNTTNQNATSVVDPSRTGTSPNVSGFLETDYEPLADWMNERFEVKYRAMTPAIIFDQVPLKDIYYETSNLPGDAKLFDYESSNISRRELLKEISTFWKLKMDYVNGEDGNPTAVKVSG